MIFNNLKAQDGDITYLCEYIPHSRTTYRDKCSEDFILAFKNKDVSAIQYACDQIVPQLGTNFAIAAVPSSKVISNGSSASHELIRKIIRQKNDKSIVDAGECLYRTHDILAQHMQKGRRDPEILLDSLDVRHQELINDMDILVIDDITTSGNSLITARDLLLKHGAKSVIGLAIGKTIDYENLNTALVLSIDSILKECPNILIDINTVLFNPLNNSFSKDYTVLITANENMSDATDINYIFRGDKDITMLLARAKQLVHTYMPCIIVCADNESDIIAAKKLGMTTVKLNAAKEKTSADENICEIKELMQS